MNLRKSFGVIYIATSEKYLAEACQSAFSLKSQHPNIDITLFSSENVKSSCFKKVVIIDNPTFTYKDKVRYMNQSPYDSTLFLDTDTYICSEILDLFTILEKFHIAASHSRTVQSYKINKVPLSFSRFNTGVLLFKKSSETHKFLDNWLILHEKNIQDYGEDVPDSLAFCEALYESHLRIATLIPEYNFRFAFSTTAFEVVKILHGRYPDIREIAQEINKETGSRFFVQGIGLINNTKMLSRIQRFSMS
jgi:hypothetical protein